MQFIQIGEADQLKSRAYIYTVDATDGITPETGEGGGRAKISINGNAPTNSINTLVAIDTTNQPGTYYLQLAPSELMTPGFISIRYKSANTAEFVNIAQIIAFDPYTRRYGDMWNGGPDIDYKRIRKMVDEAVKGIPKPEQTVIPETDLKPFLKAMEVLKQSVDGIRIPEAEKTDLGPLIEKLDLTGKRLEAAVKAIRLPEPTPTDLSPVLNEIRKVDVQQTLDEMKVVVDRLTVAADLVKKMESFFLDDVSEMQANVRKLLDIRFEGEVETMGPTYKMVKMPITIKPVAPV